MEEEENLKLEMDEKYVQPWLRPIFVVPNDIGFSFAVPAHEESSYVFAFLLHSP